MSEPATIVSEDINSFRLDSIERAQSPDGSEGAWFRYVIVQGENVITGLRAGNLAEVQPILNNMVDRLNERSGRQRAKAK